MELERFNQIYEEIIPNEQGCKVWPMGKTAAGYAQLKLGLRHTYGHRLSLEVKLGRKITPGMIARHTCDNPGCIAQEHLVEGTQKDNVQDSIIRGRFIFGDKNGSRTRLDKRPRGSSNGTAVLKEEQVLEIVRRSKTEKVATLAKEFGVTAWTITDILSGANWSHLTGIPKKVRGKKNV